MDRPSFVDVFSGCGGLSLGLTQAGWVGRLAVERHPDAFETFRANLLEAGAAFRWPEWIEQRAHAIEEVLDRHRERLLRLRGQVDLLAGGPPCQGFSSAGKRRHDDPRNLMVDRYLDMVDLLRPPFLLMENVRGFEVARMTDAPAERTETYAEYLTGRLGQFGYDTWCQTLNASDWGVPQARYRFFLIAIRRGECPGVDPFLRLLVERRRFLSGRGLPVDKPVTSSDALVDLETTGRSRVPCLDAGAGGFEEAEYVPPSIAGPYISLLRKGSGMAAPDGRRLPRHRADTVDKFAGVLATCRPGRSLNASERGRLGITKRAVTVISAHAPACTVTTLPDDIIHYREPRILTLRECARLQSFPDRFSFKGPQTAGGSTRANACPAHTQVGNAVPPLLAEALGEILLGLAIRLRDGSQEHGADLLEVG